MNGKGFTAIFDAAMVMVLLGIAVNIIAIASEPGTERDIQEPGDVLERVFYSRIDCKDIGMDESLGRMPMNRLAYVSLSSGDGLFLGYMEDVLSAVYPWPESYGLDVSWSSGEESIGVGGGEPWRTSEKVFESGYADDLRITLRVYA